MGRSNPTYRDALRAQRERWAPFRRALRRERVPHFDAVFEHAEALSHAGGYVNDTDPFRPLLFSVVVAQQAELAALRERVAALEAGGGAVGGGRDAGTGTARGRPAAGEEGARGTGESEGTEPPDDGGASGFGPGDHPDPA